MKETIRTILEQQSGHEVEDNCKINFLGMDDIDLDQVAYELSISFDCHISLEDVQSLKSLDQYCELIKNRSALAN